jgi:hypothetical protein
MSFSFNTEMIYQIYCLTTLRGLYTSSDIERYFLKNKKAHFKGKNRSWNVISLIYEVFYLMNINWYIFENVFFPSSDLQALISV